MTFSHVTHNYWIEYNFLMRFKFKDEEMFKEKSSRQSRQGQDDKMTTMTIWFVQEQTQHNKKHAEQDVTNIYLELLF